MNRRHSKVLFDVFYDKRVLLYILRLKIVRRALKGGDAKRIIVKLQRKECTPVSKKLEPICLK